MGGFSKPLHYEWMVELTPQKAWIEGKGIFLLLAFFFTEIFAGAYFISLLLNFKKGLIFAWLGALMIGGFFHMLYLGKARRGWRILRNFSTSELSRGLWVIVLYGALGLIQILPILNPGLPWAWNNVLLKIAMIVVCVLVIVHGFTTMTVVKALPMWNSPLLIPLSFCSGMYVGLQIVTVLMLMFKTNISLVETWVRLALFVYSGCIAMYLWGNLHTSETAKVSIKRILTGDCSLHFYFGTVGIGIIIPLFITMTMWGKDLSAGGSGYFIIRLVCVLIGDALMRYCLMKAPLYKSLVKKKY